MSQNVLWICGPLLFRNITRLFKYLTTCNVFYNTPFKFKVRHITIFCSPLGGGHFLRGGGHGFEDKPATILWPSLPNNTWFCDPPQPHPKHRTNLQVLSSLIATFVGAMFYQCWHNAYIFSPLLANIGPIKYIIWNMVYIVTTNISKMTWERVITLFNGDTGLLSQIFFDNME